MEPIVETLRALPADIAAARREPTALASLSDAELVQAVAAAIARPKAERRSSFLLHAPLELAARASLLAFVPPPARPAARLRIAAIAADYAPGEEIAPLRADFADAGAALAALLRALDAADADGADRAGGWLIARLSAQALCEALADAVVARLGAAAHAPILLAALPALGARFGDLRPLLRAPLRALAAQGDARLSWLDAGPDAERDAAAGPATLFEALAAPPRVTAPSLFIAPTMAAVETHGLAARLLARPTAVIPPAQALRELSRIAALSMLQDDPGHAPYGWTHCLTLAQGAARLAPHARDPRRCVRAAATHVLGFRATLGRERLVETPLAPAGGPPTSDLAAHAAAHPDAHLAKYTLACLEAAAADPEAADLFVAAAAYLARWWDGHPDAAFAA